MSSIPKIIHYCWFGKNEKPQDIIDNINEWKRTMPDFQIIEWNEENFNISQNEFVKQAYENNKYAFVTDFVRLYVLHEFGGIYMDTDVEVIKSLEPFLSFNAFTGTEGSDYCVTGTMGAIKKHPWIYKLLRYYENKQFILENGEFNDITNTKIITDITVEDYGWIPTDSYQILKEDLHIFPSVVFCAKDLDTGKVFANTETYTIHHFYGSWHDEKHLKKIERNNRIKNTLIKYLGTSKTKKILSFIRKMKY